MLNHPVSVIGWLLAALGFLLLLAWVPTSVSAPGLGMRFDPVFNLHKSMISVSIMAIGLVMAIVGTIARGFESLRAEPTLQSIVVPAAAGATAAGRPAPVERLEGGDLSQTNWIVTVKDRQGKDRELRVSNDGSVAVDTVSGTKCFPTIDDAKTYLG